ncbi:7652_t:CDS:2 [Dentiscutata erythropus]|uniref:7652_t:CDS:1 n=1 Tax=Dentiscutata erythropus TaxID=1348616 RepID=A0A9N9F0F4_9GLOM|nr:7652_t:CDS:2 [Dentiscutata erythropus]
MTVRPSDYDDSKAPVTMMTVKSLMSMKPPVTIKSQKVYKNWLHIAGKCLDNLKVSSDESSHVLAECNQNICEKGG